MKTIKDYLESLFLNIPQTPETKKAKEDLLGIMEDHYHELIAEGKSENEAIGSVISEFGSIDELLEELEMQQTREPNLQENVITVEEAESYWQGTRRFALFIGLGVLCCCLGVSLVILFSSDAEVIGVSGLFLMAAIGVSLFITGGLRRTKENRLLEDRPINHLVREMAQDYTEAYSRSFVFSLVLGIAACILAFIPIFLTIGTYPSIETFGVALFIAIAGMGSFLIIYGSIVYTNYKKFIDKPYFVTDEDEPGPKASQHLYGENYPTVNALQKIYWPLVVVAYFVCSFVFGGWGYTWLIFVVAGVLQDVVLSSLKNK